MAEGNILMKKNNPKDIIYAVTVLLLKDETVELAGETSMDADSTFKLNEDKAYRIICDVKNKLETERIANMFTEGE